MAIGKFLAPLNGRTYIQQERPYVDDIFDPLFNAEVRNYYNNLYGTLGGIGAGYASMLENALTGRKGILGPGMGILSTFGRSMDKADDFILGGLTEGVNALGQLTGGTNQAPVNPIENIFVNDYDYQGTKLMAAAGNAMARLAGTQTPLTEADFQTMGDKIAGTTLDLATDPGIMGGQLARLNKGTPVGKAGQILSDYDDLVANVAGNIAFPGGKAMVGKSLSRIRDFLSGANSASPIDYVTSGNAAWMTREQAEQELSDILEKGYTTSQGTFNKATKGTKYQLQLRDMAEDYAKAANLTPLDPEYAILEDIRTQAPKYTDVARIPDSDDYATPSDIFVFKQSQKHNEYLKAAKAQRESLEKGIEEAHEKFINDVNTDVNNFITKESKYIKDAPATSEEYTLGTMESKYYDTEDTELQNSLNDIEQRIQTLSTKENLSESDVQELNDLYNRQNIIKQDFEELKDASKIINPKHQKHWIVSHKESNRIAAPLKLRYLQNYVRELKSFDENIFNLDYIQKRFPDMYIDISPLRRLLKDDVNGIYYKNSLTRQSSKVYDELMEDLHDKFIPDILNNADKLNTTETGKRLVNFANDLDNTLFKVNTPAPDTFAERLEHPMLVDFYEKTPISEVYSPLLQGLTSVTKDSDIDTLDEFIRLKKEYPNLTLFLNEEGGAYYKASKTILKGQDYLNYLQLKYPEKNILELEEIAKKTKQVEIPLDHVITNMKELYDYMPKETYKPLALPKTANDIYRGIAEAVKDPTDAYTKWLPADQVSEFTTGVSKLPPSEFGKVVTKITPVQEIKALDVLDNTFKQFKEDWSITDDPDNLDWYIRKYGTRKEMTLFQQWRAAVDSKILNKLKARHGALETDFVKRTKVAIDNIIKSGKYDSKKLREYFSRRDIASGINISGDNFLESLWASRGFKEIPFDTKLISKDRIDEVAKTLKSNVDKVNANGNILKFVDVEQDGVRRLAVYFNVDNLNTKKDINKIYGLFGKKNLGLEDVAFKYNVNTKAAFDTADLDATFDEMRQASEVLATKLGATKFDPNYFAHTIEDTQEARDIFGKIYKDLGINKDKLDKICDALQKQDIASGKLQFGAIPLERSHLGYFSQYGNGFTTDLAKIHSQTFTSGMLSDTNAQTFFDLFLTDNFKIQNNFDSVDTLKKALFLKDKNGKLSGNLNNLSLVKPRYNESGKLIGFTRFDKFSDIDLQKAYNDAETILVPDSVIGSLDRLCKKDARMSNKVYAFINKYLTVPFKFGTLANPGFLAGNIQDAYFKQAVELSKKYGTSLEDELTNVAMSMRHVTMLNNNFDEIFEGYKSWIRSTDLGKITDNTKPVGWYERVFRKSKASIETLTIDQVMADENLYNAFKNYVDAQVPVEQRKLANLYIFLNSNQTTTMFKNNNKDLEDLTDLVTDNQYAVPNNVLERIMYGDPSKTKIIKTSDGKFKQIQDTGFKSWGLFLNNPLSNKILKSSNNIENWMRSSTILNDLQHQGYTMEDICDILELDKVAEAATRNKFKMAMNEAINTMYAANFDYDNVGNFMNKMSYILPFPTFYLKNLAFWADIFVNKPQLIDNVISTHEGLWSGKDTSKDEFTAEAKGRGAVPIGQGNKHLTGIVKQTPYNSMFGAFNAVNNLKEDMAFRVNPIARPITRHLQNPEDVKYRPYNTQQFQKNIKMGDKEFSNLSYMFHQLNPYERFINTSLRTPGKISNNSYQLSDFLPSVFQPDFSKKSR